LLARRALTSYARIFDGENEAQSSILNPES